MSTPLAVLTLRLSSPSFLETILTDNGRPVYSTETNDNTTTLSRCDPYHGLSLVANIQWPEHRSPKGKCREYPSAKVFMDGKAYSEDDLLKKNFVNTLRKFRIPGYTGSLKWRSVNGGFQCHTSSNLPIAVFEPAIVTRRARLSIFQSSLTGLPDAHPQVGVSQLLLDYVIVTSLLLQTHPEDWHGFTQSPTVDFNLTLSIPTSRNPSSSTSSPISPTSSSSLYTPSVHESPYQHGRWLPSVINISSAFKEEDLWDVDAPAEAPPPYEEIQWTVKVRQPRRRLILP